MSDVTREEFDQLVYRVDSLLDLVRRLARAVGAEEGTPVLIEDDERK